MVYKSGVVGDEMETLTPVSKGGCLVLELLEVELVSRLHLGGCSGCFRFRISFIPTTFYYFGDTWDLDEDGLGPSTGTPTHPLWFLPLLACSGSLPPSRTVESRSSPPGTTPSSRSDPRGRSYFG